jgi:hypothetical protein
MPRHCTAGAWTKTEIAVPRARLNTCDGKTTEWKSQALRAYQRRMLAADIATIPGCDICRLRALLSGILVGPSGIVAAGLSNELDGGTSAQA